MQINVKGKHIEITEAIDTYVRTKAAKLVRYFDKVLSIDCVIEKESKGFHVEFIVDVEGAWFPEDSDEGGDEGDDAY